MNKQSQASPLTWGLPPGTASHPSKPLTSHSSGFLGMGDSGRYFPAFSVGLFSPLKLIGVLSSLASPLLWTCRWFLVGWDGNITWGIFASCKYLVPALRGRPDSLGRWTHTKLPTELATFHLSWELSLSVIPPAPNLFTGQDPPKSVPLAETSL